jgi:hypothetical protein
MMGGPGRDITKYLDENLGVSDDAVCIRRQNGQALRTKPGNGRV